jgi:hypothetical protein
MITSIWVFVFAFVLSCRHIYLFFCAPTIMTVKRLTIASTDRRIIIGAFHVYRTDWYLANMREVELIEARLEHMYDAQAEERRAPLLTWLGCYCKRFPLSSSSSSSSSSTSKSRGNARRLDNHQWLQYLGTAAPPHPSSTPSAQAAFIDAQWCTLPLPPLTMYAQSLSRMRAVHRTLRDALKQLASNATLYVDGPGSNLLVETLKIGSQPSAGYHMMTELAATCAPLWAGCANDLRLTKPLLLVAVDPSATSSSPSKPLMVVSVHVSFADVIDPAELCCSFAVQAGARCNVLGQSINHGYFTILFERYANEQLAQATRSLLYAYATYLRSPLCVMLGDWHMPLASQPSSSTSPMDKPRPDPLPILHTLPLDPVARDASSPASEFLVGLEKTAVASTGIRAAPCIASLGPAAQRLLQALRSRVTGTAAMRKAHGTLIAHTDPERVLLALYVETWPDREQSQAVLAESQDLRDLFDRGCRGVNTYTFHSQVVVCESK